MSLIEYLYAGLLAVIPLSRHPEMSLAPSYSCVFDNADNGSFVQAILSDLWEREFRNVASPRFKLKFLGKAEAEKSLFLAARFGLYSSEEYYEFLGKNLNAEAFSYDAAFRSTHWPADFQTLFGLTAAYCTPTRQRVHSHAFFLLNPEDPFDVVDYWNLRALPAPTYFLSRWLPAVMAFIIAGCPISSRSP